MFFAEAQIRVHLYGEPADMRKSYDGLQALARHAMLRDPLDGALYIFVNRRGSQIKCLYFDRGGTIHQRLACGAHPRDGLDQLEAAARRDGSATRAQALCVTGRSAACAIKAYK
jgi:transposase